MFCSIFYGIHCICKTEYSAERRGKSIRVAFTWMWFTWMGIKTMQIIWIKIRNPGTVYMWYVGMLGKKWKKMWHVVTWVLARCVHGRKARWCVFQRTENVSQLHLQGYKKIGACPALQFNTQTVVWDGRNVKSMFKMFENYIRNSGKVSFRPVLLRYHGT